MKRRVTAWILLIGFVLLIANIVFIGYQRSLSLGVYAVILLYYCFTMLQGKKQG